jgi:hypothetical protein
MLISESAGIARDFIPTVYSDSIQEFGFHSSTDMSRSTKCHTMTLDLLKHLRSGGMHIRREFHRTPAGMWHYVLAHAAVGAQPSEEDVITDLNPWNYSPGGEAYTGYLQGPRYEVEASLRMAGAPEEHIALRGLSTLVAAHTDKSEIGAI